MDAAEVLDRASRSVLAFSGRRGPLLAPMAFWSDGGSLWMSTPAVSVKTRSLRVRPDVAVYVPPDDPARSGALVRGRARVYGLHDPIGLAVHGAVVSAAMTALAARNAGTILGYVQDAPKVPARFRPRNRVAVRVAMDDVVTAPTPPQGPGVAPALPPLISPVVRRALAGQRRVTAAFGTPDGGVTVSPAVWSAGFALQLPPGVSTPEGPAAVYVGTDPRRRPTQVVGLSLTGTVADGRLQPERATWWEGFTLDTADVPRATSSISLPD